MLPTCRRSSAIAGSNATAPPNNTANRSSEIAPRRIGRLRTKRSPSRAWCSVGVCPAACAPAAAGSGWQGGDGAEPRPDRRRGVRNGGVDVVQQPARRRTDDHAELPRRRVEGDQPGQSAVRGDQRRDRAHRRQAERADRSEEGGEPEDRHGTGRRRRGVQAQQQRDADLHGEGDRGDPATVEAIGDRSGERQEQQRRHELDEAEQTEGELAVGDVVHVLGEDGGLHRDGDRRRRLGDEERGDPTVTDDLAGGRRHWRGWRCRRHRPPRVRPPPPATSQRSAERAAPIVCNSLRRRRW